MHIKINFVTLSKSMFSHLCLAAFRSEPIKLAQGEHKAKHTCVLDLILLAPIETRSNL